MLENFGPFPIPFYRKKKIKRINYEHIALFWDDTGCKEMAGKQGCYIFAIKSGKGFTPWYVGLATKNFKQECFMPHKTKKYNSLLFEGKKGTPVMFFVARPGKKKKIQAPIIKEMEKFLILSAVTKNTDILNVQNTKNFPKWGIRGLIRSGKGKISEKNKRFATMMGL